METYLIIIGATYLFLYYRFSRYEKTAKDARKQLKSIKERRTN